MKKPSAKVSPIKGRSLTDLSAAVVQKTVNDQRGAAYTYTTEMMPSIAQRHVHRMVKQFRDNEMLIQQLPEIEIIEAILVSSIISPNSMVTVELTFTVPPGSIDAELAGKLIAIIDAHLSTVYKIKDQLQTIVSDALIRRGSYPIAVIPESNIDRLINGHDTISMQSLTAAMAADNIESPIGLLGEGLYTPNTTIPKANEQFSLQSFIQDRDRLTFGTDMCTKAGKPLGIKVIDNFNLLKIPALRERVREERRAVLLNRHSGCRSPSMQSFTNKEKDEIIKTKFYRQRNNHMTPIVNVPVEGHRDNIGGPLIMTLSHESTIPVHAPGKPEHHVGYFVPHTESGYPININQNISGFEVLQQRLNFKVNDAKQLLADLTGNAQGSEVTQNTMDAELLTRLYTEAVERDLRTRLGNGTYDPECGISSAPEVYRMMLARHLANKYTQLVFIPADFVTYFAFDYNLDGTGRSLLDKNLIIGSMRTLLTLAELYRAIQASTPNIDLNIELDPRDKDPSQTVSFLYGEYVRNATASFPFAVGNPADQLDYLQRSGVRLNVTGNTRYPQTKVTAETRQGNQPQVDNELRDSLKDRFIQGMWLNPEQIDAAKREDFATSVIARNLLMNKRIVSAQDIFLPQLKDHIYKYVTAHQPLMDELLEVVKTAKKEQYPPVIKEKTDSQEGEMVMDLLYWFLDCLEVNLPRPDGAQLKTQMEDLDQYAQYLDTILEYIVGRDIITAEELGPNAEIDMDQVKATVKAIFMRRYMAENGILPELQEITTVDQEGKAKFNLMNEHRNHVEKLRKTLGDYIIATNEDLQKEREKYDKRQAKLNEATAGKVDENGEPLEPEKTTISAFPAKEGEVETNTEEDNVATDETETDFEEVDTEADTAEEEVPPEEAAKAEEDAAEATPDAAEETPPEETPDENDKI